MGVLRALLNGEPVSTHGEFLATRDRRSLAKLRSYQRIGMEAFILSGYPHTTE